MKFFTFYTDNYEPIRDLSLEQKGRLLDAAFLYTLGEPLPEMDPVTSMAWGFIKSHIDGARDKYEEIRQKRSEAGKKSAESKAKQSQQVLTKPTILIQIQIQIQILRRIQRRIQTAAKYCRLTSPARRM